METMPLTIPDWLPDKKEIGLESTKPLDIPILIPFKQSDKTGNQVGFIPYIYCQHTVQVRDTHRVSIQNTPALLIRGNQNPFQQGTSDRYCIK